MELPRVTAILKTAGLIDDEWFTDYARDRGSALHLACQYHDEGTLDQNSIDPAIRPYLDAYVNFLDVGGAEVVEIEMEVQDPILGYAGRLDRIIYMSGKTYVVDLKAGGPAPWHGIQLAAYRNALPASFGLVFRANLYLRPPQFGFVPRDGRQDFAVFQAALTIHNWKVQCRIK